MHKPEESEPRWLPIESNPEVMNQFLYNVGMPLSWAMTDVYGLDEELLKMIPQPVCALILLFPDGEKYEEHIKTIDFCDQKVSNDVYYMKQTIDNACGTVAMIHSVANCLDVINLENGILKDFLLDTKECGPNERARKLEENLKISGMI